MTRTASLHPISLSLLIGFIASTTALFRPPWRPTEADWARAVTKGSRLVQKMQSGCYPDTVNPIDLDALIAIGFRIGDDEKSRWPPTFEEASVFAPSQLFRFKWTARQKAYWRTSVDRLCKFSCTRRCAPQFRGPARFPEELEHHPEMSLRC